MMRHEIEQLVSLGHAASNGQVLCGRQSRAGVKRAQPPDQLLVRRVVQCERLGFERTGQMALFSLGHQNADESRGETMERTGVAMGLGDGRQECAVAPDIVADLTNLAIAEVRQRLHPQVVAGLVLHQLVQHELRIDALAGKREQQCTTEGSDRLLVLLVIQVEGLGGDIVGANIPRSHLVGELARDLGGIVVERARIAMGLGNGGEDRGIALDVLVDLDKLGICQILDQIPDRLAAFLAVEQLVEERLGTPAAAELDPGQAMQSFAFNRPPPGRYGSQIAAAHLFQVDGDVGLQPLQSGAIGARLRPFRPIGRDARIGQVSATDIDARHPFPPIWTGSAHRYHNRCVWIGLCQTAQPGAIRAGFGQPARRDRTSGRPRRHRAGG